MDLMQLKVPADKARLIANAIEHHILSGDAQDTEQELSEILIWLRYRIQRFTASRDNDPTA